MDQQAWFRIRDVFEAAVNLPPDERAAYIRKAMDGDEALIEELEAMLRHDDETSSLLDARLSQIEESRLEELVAVPEQVGPYRVLRELGRGGMSVVYLAERDDLDYRVALKVLATGPMSPFSAERFFAEERVLARLHHPSIARILDAGILPGSAPYFVMEYVDGTPITNYVVGRKPSLRSLLRLFLRTCEAVSHAHRQAIIHRDLKPSNILVTTEGKVKLLDFGIAKRLDEDVFAGAPTIRMLTPAYAAPEQIRGEPVGVQADVYALGVVLYEMLTGLLPVDPSGKSFAEFEQRTLTHLPTPPSKCLRVDVPSRRDRADIDSLCLRALSPRVADRYPSVEALMRDIERFLNDRPLEARKPVWQYRAGKFMRRNRRPLVAAVGVTVLLVGVTLYYSLSLAEARDSALAEAERVQRIQHFMLGLFEGDDAGIGPSDTLRVVTVLEAGVREAHLLENDRDVQAELYQTLGTLFMHRGALDRADSLLTASLDLRRHATPGADSAPIARSLVALALLRIEQAEYDAADAFIDEGMELARTTFPTGHPDIAEALFAAGSVHQARGEYDRAVEMFGSAVRLLSGQRNAGVALSRALGQLASSHFYAGRYETSDSLNRLLLAMEERTYGRRHPAVAGTLVNLGATRFQLGHPRDAEQMYRRALEIYLGYYGPDHHLTASNMSMLAQALVRQQRLDEAAELLRPALDVRERVFGPMHPRVANSLSELGTLELLRENYDAAEEHFGRMLEIYLATYDGDHFHTAVALSNLASVYHNRGEYERAHDAMTETTRIFVSALGPDHMQVGYARLKHGRTLAMMGRADDARAKIAGGLDILAPILPEEDAWLVSARRTLEELDGLAIAAR